MAEARDIDTRSIPYVMLDAPRATCPNGHSPPKLLMPDDLVQTAPAFYICFECGYVGQVGVRPVPDVSNRDAPSKV